MASFNPSLLLCCLLQGLIIDVNRCFNLGYLPPQHPLTCDGYGRRQLYILQQTAAVSVEPDLALASCENREVVALQLPRVSLTACLYAHCGRCHLSFPPSNNIFRLSAVPRRLQCKEIRGRHNYRWGKLRHCLLEANWIWTETAG